MTAVIAHRGASRVERENTLAAFEAARRLGADMVEFDVRHTADGALVIHHDAWLPDGRAVADIAAADRPAHVPLLDEAIDACAGMGVHVEVKNAPNEPGYDAEGVVAPLVATLRRHDRLRVIVSSFDLDTIDRVRRREAAIETAWLVMAIEDSTLETLLEHGHESIHPWHGSVTADVVRRCAGAGVAVNVWTCDEPNRIQELARWGVAGICTNVPDIARRALEAMA